MRSRTRQGLVASIIIVITWFIRGHLALDIPDEVLAALLTLTVGWAIDGYQRRTMSPVDGGPRIDDAIEKALKSSLLVICVFMLAACGTLDVTADKGQKVHYLMDVGPPHHFEYRVDGKWKCRGKGPQFAAVKGKPGTCLKAGADGIFKKVACE